MNDTILLKEIKQWFDFWSLIDHVKKIVQEHWFGILYEIDFQQKFAAGLGKTFTPYYQLWICNPSIGFSLLDGDKKTWALLPCPVCIYEEKGSLFIVMVHPSSQLWLMDSPEVGLIAQKADCLVDEMFAKL